MIASLLIGAMFAAPEDPELTAAKALDREISDANALPDGDRAKAIRDLAARIRRTPPKYAVALANNLVVSGTEAASPATIQLLADTLAASAAAAPERMQGDAYSALARLARYNGARVKSKHPNFIKAVKTLAQEDARRQSARFTLRDLDGKEWSVEQLRGQVVLVNFWATWCPPCRKELPDLAAVWSEFESKGLVVLAISDEDPGVIRRFLSAQPVSFPILLDPSKQAKEALLVQGIPATFLYDKRGKLVAQMFDRPTPDRLRRLLRKAGLR